MASTRSSVDILFKEHSFEEIATVRDNLASEIDKRTELLKSIVKEKYRDVVDTSDAIQSMKLNISRVEQSIQQLEKSISEFHSHIKEHHVTKRTATDLSQSKQQIERHINASETPDIQEDDDIRETLATVTGIWDHFDAGNLKATIKTYHKAKHLLEKCQGRRSADKINLVLENLKSNLKRSEDIIKNHLWHKIQSAEPNQIGVIVNDDDDGDLYTLSLESSMRYLVEKLRRDILDVSLQAQIRRYQQYSYFNTETNTIDENSSDSKAPAAGFLQIPREVSPELSDYLFNICRVINTIAGFSLASSSRLESLRMTMTQVAEVYHDQLPSVESMSGGSKRRRALQLYFDLMYIRVLLNTSKNIELIEELDPKISSLMSKYEGMLDTIELYIVSDAMHTNVLNLIKSTMRVYGLLVPYLQ